MTVWFIILGGLILGGGICALWFSKSGFKKPKVKGKHREYYTKGEAIILKLRGKL